MIELRCDSKKTKVHVRIRAFCILRLWMPAALLGGGWLKIASQDALDSVNEPVLTGRFEGLAPRAVWGWPDTSVTQAIAKESREVAVFPLGVQGPGGFPGALVCGMGYASESSGQAVRGVHFQAVDMRLCAKPAEVENKSVFGGPGCFLEHNQRVIVGDWGSMAHGDDRRGAICALVDEHDIPVEFWAMDSTNGPRKLNVPPPSVDLRLAWFSLLGTSIPASALCGWEVQSKQDNRVALFALELGKEARPVRAVLAVWNGTVWTVIDLPSGIPFDEADTGSVLGDLRLGRVGGGFGVVGSFAPRGTGPKLFCYDEAAGYTDIPTDFSKNRHESLHIVPGYDRVVDGRTSSVFSVLSTARPGRPLGDFYKGTDKPGIDVLLVSTGKGHGIEPRILGIGGFLDGAFEGMQGFRMQSVHFWKGTSGIEYGLMSGSYEFYSCLGAIASVEDAWQMPETQAELMFEKQFLNAYAVTWESPECTVSLAPNLFFGNLGQPPGKDPLTLVTIEKGSLKLFFESISEEAAFSRELLRVARK